MILFHGFSDGFINPFNTIQFYEDWAHLQGGYSALSESARLFMIPGMYHCSGGPGPNTFDALGALEEWVEHGHAPESITAFKSPTTRRSTRSSHHAIVRFPQSSWLCRQRGHQESGKLVMHPE